MGTIKNLFIFVFCCLGVSVAASVDAGLARLEKNVARLEGLVNALTSENLELKGKLAILEKKGNLNEERINELESVVCDSVVSDDSSAHNEAQRKTEISAAEKDVSDIEGDVPLSKTITGEDVIKQLSDKSSALDEIITKRIKQDPPNIAFHAVMSNTGCFHVHEPYIYDKVEMDTGEGYNSMDGIYSVPVTGTYVFAFTIVSDHHNWLQSELVVNNLVKATAMSDADEVADYHPSSAMTIIHVNNTDQVFVRAAAFSSCKIISDGLHGKSTVSAWKLF